jgi:hypothetical protein
LFFAVAFDLPLTYLKQQRASAADSEQINDGLSPLKRWPGLVVAVIEPESHLIKIGG